MRRLFVLLIATIIMCSTGNTVFAATGKTDVAVSPAIREWVVEKGSVVKKSFILTNTSSTFIPIEANAEELTPYQDEQAVVANAGSWFSFVEPDFILKPKESRRVTVIIKVPKNAEPGGHYATLYFRQLGPLLLSPHSDVVGSVGALNFITVRGALHKDLEAESISVSAKHDTATVAVRIRNDGNVHTFPTGSIVIKDWWGREVQRSPFPVGLVLPQTTRTFTGQWKLPSPGVYTVYTELALGNRLLRPLSATIWDVPWIGALYAALMGLIAWFGVFRLRSRWKRAIEALFN